MTRDEAILEACGIFSLAYHSIGKYAFPSDGFCFRCIEKQGGHWTYQNKGKVFDYVRKAVLAQLKADGYDIARGFDPRTGKERPHV